MNKNRSWQIEDIKFILNKNASLIEWNDRDKSVLHYGCGTGFLTKFLQQYCLKGVERLLGVDDSKEKIKFARKYYGYKNLDYKVLDGEKWIVDEKFQHVMSFYNIGAEINERKLFENFYNHLNENGDLMLIILNNHGMYEISKRVLKMGKWRRVGEGIDIKEFQKSETYLRETLKKLGFCDVVCEIYDRYQIFPTKKMLKRFLFSGNELSAIEQKSQDDFVDDFLLDENSDDLIKRVGKNRNVIAVPYQTTFIYAKKST